MRYIEFTREQESAVLQYLSIHEYWKGKLYNAKTGHMFYGSEDEDKNLQLEKDNSFEYEDDELILKVRLSVNSYEKHRLYSHAMIGNEVLSATQLRKILHTVRADRCGVFARGTGGAA